MDAPSAQALEYARKMGFWFEVELERLDEERLRVRGRGSRGEESSWVTIASTPLQDFAEALKQAADDQSSLDARKAQAQALYEALFQSELRTYWERLRGEARDAPVLLEWKVKADTDLPLEALCEPGPSGEFLGLSARILPVRSIAAGTAWQPWEVEGAVRVLAVVPEHEAELGPLRVALQESIAAGEVEWAPPVTGVRAQRKYLLDRLETEPEAIHVLHVVGHLGLVDGEPCLKLADEAGKASWMPVADLATALERRFARTLRLVVLQACEGAKPGAVASGAERLMAKGASAVVAHLWKARTDVARLSSVAFLRALTQSNQKRGDVAASLNHARRQVWNRNEPAHGAEAFSPVLYLRGHQPGLFDFEARSVRPTSPERARALADPRARSVLDALWGKPFSLVLGDAWKSEQSLHARLEEKLREKLLVRARGTRPGLPTSTLAEHFRLYQSRDHLERVFEDAFEGELSALRAALAEGEMASPERPFADPALALVCAVAKRLGPGVHVTLLRLPVLELALARYQPERTLYVVQPPRQEGEAPTVLRRSGGGWEESAQEALSRLDLERDMLVLRLYRGYQAGGELMQPLIAEDDYLGSPGLREVLGDMADRSLATLWGRPALFVGLSVLAWPHRRVLQQIFEGRPLPRGSTALLERGTGEAELWMRGRGLPGEARSGVAVVEGGVEELAAQCDGRGDQ